VTLDLQFWAQLKEATELVSGWPATALHILLGVIGQLLVAALLRTSIADLRPWGVILLLELANEALDLRGERWLNLLQQIAEGASDLLATLLLPTLLLLLARHWPGLLTPQSASPAEQSGEAE